MYAGSEIKLYYRVHIACYKSGKLQRTTHIQAKWFMKMNDKNSFRSSISLPTLLIFQWNVKHHAKLLRVAHFNEKLQKNIRLLDTFPPLKFVAHRQTNAAGNKESELPKRKFTNTLHLEKRLQLNFHRNTVRTHESLFMCKTRRAKTRDKTSNSPRHVIISRYVQLIFGKLDKLSNFAAQRVFIVLWERY